jgi:hypothetical protein
MRHALRLFVPLLVPVIAFAQTVYKVPADTKGNSIVLTVANESATAPAGLLTVRPVGTHSGVSITPGSATIKHLAGNATSDVSFSFDVGREVKINSRDTLHFEICDKTGTLGTKSIILNYSGPLDYRLEQNFPNPFNPTTTIYYDLPADSWVSIAVYDIVGREVTKLADEAKETGYHTVTFDTHNLASGAYIYRMVAQPVAGGKTYMNLKKLMVLK